MREKESEEEKRERERERERLREIREVVVGQREAIFRASLRASVRRA